MSEVCVRDCCCEIGISVCCVVTIWGVVVTIAICGIVLVIGRHKLVVRVVVIFAAELDGVCEIGVWFDACPS